MEYNLSGSNQFKNTTNKFTNDGTLNGPVQITFIIPIVINIITSPVTVLLNVLVIMAVRRRPRLQTYANILLACLAATDVLTGLISQPSFILYGTFQLLIMSNSGITVEFSLRILSLCSLLHLMLITCDRPYSNQIYSSLSSSCHCFVHDGEDEFRLCLTNTTY